MRSVDAFGNTGDGPILTFTEFGPPPIPADRNGDGHVDGVDLTIILAAFGTSEPGGDANGDNFTDGIDLAIVLAAFGL